jgi:PIN domain nuclease of toxin-antitoxin system
LVTLIDTQSLVWSQLDERRLSRAARSAIQRSRSRGELTISVFTLYELRILIEKGKIGTRESPEALIGHFIEGLLLRPVTAEIAIEAAQFPIDFPRDPGDRIIAATARVEGIPLVTADQRIQASRLIKTIW